MADVGVVYTLTTPGPDITFNQGIDPFDGTDKFYITEIRGLESPDLRTPTDLIPLGDGALVHDYWYGARHILVEGTILITSVRIENDIVEIRNDMTQDLVDALDSILRVDGTFAFDPQGSVASTTYTVRYEVGLQTTHTSNYHQLDFSFGLIAAVPNP